MYRTPIPYDPNLPVLYTGTVTRVAPMVHPFPSPKGTTPVITLKLDYLDLYYSIPASAIQRLAKYNVIPYQGNPDDEMACMIDMETSLLAYAFLKRKYPSAFNPRTIADAVDLGQGVTCKLRRIVARFLHAHSCVYGHLGEVVGYRISTPGVDAGTDFAVHIERNAFDAYCAGRGED